MFGYTIVKGRFSDCLEFAAVDLLKGKVIVRFKSSGDEYIYKNVSRRKILNLLINDNMSLGFWGQSLFRDAIQENRYRPQTGALTYDRIGNSLRSNAVPSYIAALQPAY